jgi:hypothetical protein
MVVTIDDGESCVVLCMLLSKITMSCTCGTIKGIGVVMEMNAWKTVLICIVWK